MKKITLGIICWLTFGFVQAQNSSEIINNFQNLTEKNIIWIIIPNFDQIVDKFYTNPLFTAKGFYKDCEIENCNCEKLFKNNINDLIIWAEFIKKINIGTVSKNNFLPLSRIKGRDDAYENVLWNLIKFFMKILFGFNRMNSDIIIKEKPKNIFIQTLNDLKILNQRFLMITVSPNLTEFNTLLENINDKIITIITGSCKTKSPYLATENSKLFESIKTIYEIPHVVKSILDNCNGLCNNTLPRVKKRVIRSNDDEIIQYDKLDEDIETQTEEIDNSEEEFSDTRNSSSNLTTNLIIIIEFLLTIILTFIQILNN